MSAESAAFIHIGLIILIVILFIMNVMVKRMADLSAELSDINSSAITQILINQSAIIEVMDEETGVDMDEKIDEVVERHREQIEDDLDHGSGDDDKSPMWRGLGETSG